MPQEAKEPIPADEHHPHFGGGQTEAVQSICPRVVGMALNTHDRPRPGLH